MQDGTNFIWGNNNDLSDTSIDGNFVFGSDNIISSGVKGAIVLGNNITVTGGNTTYANNINISSGGTLTIGDKIIGGQALTLMDAASSTGLYEFGSSGITVASSTTFNVGNVKGWIVDSNDVLNSNPTFIDYSGQTNLSTPFLNTQPATYLMVNTGSTLVMLGARPTATQRRNLIYLGVVGHPTGTLTGIGNQPDIIMNEMSQVRAMFEPIRYINGGVTCYNGGTNLQLANTSGILYGLGIGFIANGNQAPTVMTILGGAPTTFQYRSHRTTFPYYFIDPLFV
jgi:hypothetical protein